ncbi:MAG: putative dienelactone hydrolase [Phenylobacterium sp.]|jgi:predicted dienelactone hydrolase
MTRKTLIKLTTLFLLVGLVGCGGGGGSSSQPSTTTPTPAPPPVTSPFGVEQTYQPPQWQGSFTVATTTYHWQDTSRDEPHTADTSDNREVLVRLFYPTDAALGDNKLPLLTDSFWQREGSIEAISGKALRPANFNGLSWNIISHNEEDAQINAPVSDMQSSYPLVVFSNGYGLTPEMHINIAADLASRGFIVASVNHPYGSGETTFADGRQVFSQQLPSDNLGADLQLWSDDQLFVVEQLQNNSLVNNDLLFARLDQRIGTMGHSYGGAAAYYSAWQDSRVLAAINMDGTIFNRAGKDIGQPFMYMQSNGGYDHDVFDQVSNDGYAVTFQNQIDHLSFADLVSFWAWGFPDSSPYGPMQSAEALVLMSDLTAQFFNKYFDQAAAPLLDDPDAQPQNIEIVKFD